uniref:SAP domain-containing protein n=1 Tax=Octactis speculum TaxID=3111310 RepID=A0A7S2FRX3_9STRA|mmetsp:Transcript_28683/g.39127  ORF Transcript_28683/g.39127 Transcript_28683/m.39127 type:complete len:114 (+) Transcript_28683:155-496(+)
MSMDSSSVNTKMQENLRKLDEYFACALVVKEKAEVEVEVDKKIEEQERNAGLKRQRDEIKALAKEGMGELKHMSVTVLKTKCAARRLKQSGLKADIIARIEEFDKRGGEGAVK